MQAHKTPVSMLQEMMVKRGTIPNYELIHDGGGTHDSTFIYQVSCEGCSATGTGRCKKDAKHMAAKNLLEAIALRNNYPQLPASPAQSPVHMPVPDSPTFNTEKLKQPFINAVGALQDLCAEHNLSSPIYIPISDEGPPHFRTFTIQCAVSTFKEDGKAKTKKQAKHDAAQKMLDRLRNVLKDQKINDPKESETYNDESSLANCKAIKRMLEVTKVPSKKTNLGTKMNEYHLAMKTALPADKCQDILQNLTVLNSQCCEKECDISDELTEQLVSNLQECLQEYSVNSVLESRSLTSNEQSTCLHAINLQLGIDIMEIGYGKTKAEATIMTLRNFIQTMISFLS